MFRNIIVPMTAESLPTRAIKRAASISEAFGCQVILLYIIDPKVLEIMDQASCYALSPYDRERVRDDVTLNQEERARAIILDRTRKHFGKSRLVPKRLIRRGDFSEVIRKVARKEEADMVFLEFKKDAYINWQILHMAKIPTWLERGKSIENILVLTSNLAPNKRGPMYAADLANMYNSNVTFCYVIDPTEKEESKDLLEGGKRMIKDFIGENPKVEVESVIREGHIEDVLPTLVDQFDPGLVIMGRFKKSKKRIFGLVQKDVKTELAKTLGCNILVVK